ncbi:MAG: hypothetical protein PHF21_01795 [Bacilli bacterium]|nr:hypothetical protein [Bacilli bacterium]
MKHIKKKYLLYMILGIITVFSVIIFGTLAIFRASKTQSSSNVISTLSCINVSITGNNSSLTLNNTYPILDSEGVTITPYTFTVKNNCDNNIQYQIIMSIQNSTTITNKDYVKIDLDGPAENRKQILTNIPIDTVSGLTGYQSNYTLTSHSFEPNESHIYNFRMWLNGENEAIWNDNSITNKTMSVKLSIVGVAKTESFNSLKNKILAQGGGASAIEAKGTPAFNVINGTSGLYAAEDEYGMSYYYRGKKSELNNNIIWGGFQWKIVRINGDGSVRLIYNGTEAQFNTNGYVNDTGSNTEIGISAFNSNINDAKYVGYMYGGANGVASDVRHGTTSEAATYNETNSNIKNELDNWYASNIAEKSFEADIVDNLFCNDRQLANEIDGTNSGPGYGNTGVQTNYAGRYRLYETKSPTFKCGLKNDRFTKSDTTIGNGALTHPVGMLSADEAAMAGLVYGRGNSTNYLYTNEHYWVFSPSYMSSSGYAHAFDVGWAGDLYYSNVNYSIGVRPAVSINSKTRVTGNGSNTNPFKVEAPKNTLYDKILAQDGGRVSIEAKGTPDFSEINGTSGLYAAEDEYGTSYYYRGVKTELNNNLIWGGFQWKIVRINGDGSIRLVYNGTESQFNTNGYVNDTGSNTEIGISAFNSNINDAKYVGYMYGGANGVASDVRHGTTSEAATYNETNSNIKNELDNWYASNIAEKSFEADIVDNLFCNDRQLANEIDGTNSGPGYGNTGVQTNYAGRYRLYETKSPTFKCGLKNDRFTKSDTTIGNGALTHPVGMLSADEAAMAGLVYGRGNSTNYLYTNEHYWVFSPSYMSSSGYAHAFDVGWAGDLYYSNVNYSIGVRPAVSINSKTRVTGSGSNVDPYKVV